MPKLNFKGARIVTAAALSVPLLANANISCSGPITYLGSDSNGLVYTATGTGINAICNVVTQGSFHASPQACKLFYASLLASQMAGKSATVFYDDPSLTQCSQITAWTTQFSAYFVTSGS